jgi:single-strand DNA-binding protein
MNTLKNTVRLIGRLGQDPEVRSLDKGNKVARFSLATGEKFKGKDGQERNETQWHNLIVWGNLAGICEKYLTKGKEIAVEGKLTYRNWEDNNGIKHYATEIVVNELMFLGNKQ